MPKASGEIVEFIACGTTRDNVVAFRTSDATKARVGNLIRRRRRIERGRSHRTESYLQFEQLMRLTKAGAKRHLGA